MCKYATQQQQQLAIVAMESCVKTFTNETDRKTLLSLLHLLVDRLSDIKCIPKMKDENISKKK